MTTPDQVAAYITATIFAVMAGVERFRSHKKTKKSEVDDETLSLAKASQERANLLAKILEENKSLLLQERTEHKATRDFWHEENGKAQKLLSEANLKVLELQDRPDLREVITELKLQGAALQLQGKGIEQLLLIMSQK